MNRRLFISKGVAFAGAALLAEPTLGAGLFRPSARAAQGRAPFARISKTEAEWRRLLTPEQYRVVREKATEAPYSSALNKNYRRGTYVCVGCALPLFSSRTKYDSHTGWPSFWSPVAKRNVREEADNSLPSEPRTEVLCARCDAHLGHVFDDGPPPTGLRYCINGLALRFVGGR